jgi:hypothetical protein
MRCAGACCQWLLRVKKTPEGKVPYAIVRGATVGGMVEPLRIRWGAPSDRAPCARLHPPEHQLG